MPFQHEALAAARDRDIERDFDLAQVLVECAAQGSETLVVDRGQRDFYGFWFQVGGGVAQWKNCGVFAGTWQAARWIDVI
jgi:hypothetical protein